MIKISKLYYLITSICKPIRLLNINMKQNYAFSNHVIYILTEIEISEHEVYCLTGWRICSQFR